MRNLRNITKISLMILLLISIAVPLGVLAQDAQKPQGQFIPCGLYADGKLDECKFEHLLKLVKNILDWVVMISFPAAIITFAWAGFLLLTTGIADKRTEAKKMLWKVVIGFAIILAAWLIVKTIVNLLVPGVGDQFIVF